MRTWNLLRIDAFGGISVWIDGTVSVQPQPPEFMFLTIEEIGIYILGIPDACKKCEGHQAGSQ